MFTRKQVLNQECTHSEYYGQFVTLAHKETVLNIIGLWPLKKTAGNMSKIDLSTWDAIKAPAGTANKMKLAGDYLTLSGQVCIAKETARQVYQQINNQFYTK